MNFKSFEPAGRNTLFCLLPGVIMKKSSTRLKTSVISALAVVVLASLAGQLIVGFIISRPAQTMSVQSETYEQTARKVMELSGC